MNYKMMGRIFAEILALEAFFMLPPLFISIYDGVDGAAKAFLYTIGILIAVSAFLWLICRKAKRGFYAQEGIVCVGLGWIFLSLFGALPFFISGEIPFYIDAFFEMVSGFTTTGASIVPVVEDLSRGILYWRSFSHWLGGMGVLVFLLAIVPSNSKSGGSRLHLLKAESPGPDVGKLVPKMRDTAMILYVLYIALTLLNILFLLAGKMPLFDALCTAFGTAGTGGFGIKNDSIAGYSIYIQWVCTVFMMLFGVNFNCYYLLIMRQFKALFKNEEVRCYFGISIMSAVLIAIDIRKIYPTIHETIRHACFQVASIMTTTGFATTDFDTWPSFSKTILLTLMVIGACAGSTGGGLKCARVLLLFKNLRRNIHKILHPRRVQVVHVDGTPVDEKIINGTSVYLAAYFILVVLSILLISVDNKPLVTNLSAVLSCFNNIGPGLEIVGPTGNFSSYSAFSKLVLIFDMLAGRLEIFPILALISRGAWKKA